MKTLFALLALGSIASAEPLEVTVKPSATTWSAAKPVDVVLSVTNTSKTKQSIKVWLCSWEDNWKSSDPELVWSPWGCDKNYERDEVLAPGAAKTWTLLMYPSARAKLGAHELRMGFTAKGRAQQWSNPVSITVTK